ALARPIDRSAQSLHLMPNRIAILFLPLPAALDEFLRTHLAPEALPFASPVGLRRLRIVLQRLATQLLLHDHLRGDRGVDSARQPEDVFAAHPAPAHQDVD